MKYLITCCLLFVCSECYAGKIVGAWTNKQILSVLEVADVSNGIDATEARALAEAYFRMTEGSDGGLWSFERKGVWWEFETIVGQGTEGSPIKIHVTSGLILKKGGSLVKAPWKKVKSWFADYEAAEAKSKK